MKSGHLNYDIQEEDIIWYDRKRTLFGGFPWSFTRYTLTASRLFLKVGFFKVKEDELRLYRITDVTFTQSFLERIFNTGTICLISSDTSNPQLLLEHIKRARKIKEVLSQCVEKARIDNGVRTSEFVGSGAHGPGPKPEEGPHHDGPEDGFPDANNNGIDDREE